MLEIIISLPGAQTEERKMFTCKIADTVFSVKNKYHYLHALMADYSSDEVPSYTLSVSENELAAASAAEGDFPPEVHESLLIYRKMLSVLADKNAFLMHSSLLSLNGKGYVFTAKSGTGKTTHSLLWKRLFGAEIINGDKPIYKLENGTIYGYGTPFAGKEGFNKNSRVPVKAVCFLFQAKENTIRRLTAHEVILKIFDQVHLPEEREKKERVLALLDKMITDLPFYYLGCNISDEAAELSHGIMTKGE